MWTKNYPPLWSLFTKRKPPEKKELLMPKKIVSRKRNRAERAVVNAYNYGESWDLALQCLWVELFRLATDCTLSTRWGVRVSAFKIHMGPPR